MASHARMRPEVSVRSIANGGSPFVAIGLTLLSVGQRLRCEMPALFVRSRMAPQDIRAHETQPGSSP